jgi:hypothetical protein
VTLFVAHNAVPEGATGLVVYLIIIQMAATAALLVGHFAVIVKNQLTRTR